jgi:hypothetical protein
MELLDDRGPRPLRSGVVRFEIVDVDPGHVRPDVATSFTIELEDVEQRVPDAELDPRVPVFGLRKRVGPLGEVTPRLEAEHVGEPSCGRRRAGVVHAERQARDVDLLVWHPVPLRAPRGEPVRNHAAPRCPSLVGTAGREDVLHRHARPLLGRHETDLGQHVVEAAGERQQRARLPPCDARPFEGLARRRLVEHLHDAAADSGLAPNLDHSSAVAPEVDRTRTHQRSISSENVPATL